MRDRTARTDKTHSPASCFPTHRGSLLERFLRRKKETIDLSLILALLLAERWGLESVLCLWILGGSERHSLESTSIS